MEKEEIALSKQLIACPSVTPQDKGAIPLLASVLKAAGFSCDTQVFSSENTPPVTNLYARLGTTGPNFCFAGHTDVVPPGDLSLWEQDPFSPSIKDGKLYGRGAVDMKCAIACFVTAAKAFGKPKHGSISLLITGDEEGKATDGTVKMLEWLTQKGERLDACLVGEPTNPTALGEMVKIGRRGSITFTVHLFGKQGHVAYPHNADNPVRRLNKILHALDSHRLDEGTAYFQPSNLEITSFDVGNTADNVIPAMAKAVFNIRFNDSHTSKTLIRWVESICNSLCEDGQAKYTLTYHVSGEAFITPPGPFTNLVKDAIKEATGKEPELSTSGGTSDARFIKSYCPVVEFGLINKTAHQINEHADIQEISQLVECYKAILTKFFSANK